MLYKKLFYVTFIAAQFLTSRVYGETITVTAGGNYECTATDQCLVTCDDSKLEHAVTVNCGSASECRIECTEEKCFGSSVFNAQNSDLLVVEPVGKECFKKSTFNLPDAGGAIFRRWLGTQANKQLRGITVNTGIATTFILIDCTGTGVDGCKEITVDARTARFLRIVAGSGDDIDLNSNAIYCPRDNRYTGSEEAPCIIDVSAGGYFSNGDVYTVDGYPEDLVISKGSGVVDNVRVHCEINGGDSGYWTPESGGVCENHTGSPTAAPTAAPTVPTTSPTDAPSFSPTRAPTGAPTFSPTRAPTDAPSYSPTRAPSFPPTAAPTRAPTYSPTDAPSFSPTKAPTDAPTFSPTRAPTDAPSYSPTAAPTFPPTRAPTDAPTFSPSDAPTFSPTRAPTDAPSYSPTAAPSFSPTKTPSAAPTFSPTRAPTAAPSFSPTAAPSVSPTAAPTRAPTRSPSAAPSFSPTAAPTRSPSFSPTRAPTSAPSFSPTFSPSFSPTRAPTAAPSFSPTAAPSRAPTAAPSFSPTKAPTDAPSFSPTDAPSFSPTQSPSAAPTQAPTVLQTETQVQLFMYYNMTEKFTNIILQEFNRKLAYAVELGVQYAIYNNSYEQSKFMYGEYVCVSFTLASYDVNDGDWDARYDCVSPVNYAKELGKPDNAKADVYKPDTKEAQYLAVIELVLTGDNKNDSQAKVEELSESLNGANISNETTATPNDEDEDNDQGDDDGQRRRLLTHMQTSFTEIVEHCMMTSDNLQRLLGAYPLADTALDCSGYIGLDLEEFVVVSLDAQQFTVILDPPPKSLVAAIVVDILRYTIYVFCGCCLLTAVFGKWHATSIHADNVKPWSIFWFALYTWDFYSDLLFCVRLLEYCVNRERQFEIVWWIFGASTLFVVVPWILNMRQLTRAQKKWTTDVNIQEGVRGWFIDWSIILMVAVAMTGSSFGAIELANSNLFGHDLFCMGLSKKHLKAFQGKRFFSSVLFENAPQLIAQIYFLVLLGGFDEATVTALLSSGVSIVLSVVDIWSAKHLVKVMKKQARIGQDVISLQFRIDTNLNTATTGAIDEIEQLKRLYLGQPKALSKAIAETLVVHRRNIEIYQLIAANPGIKVGCTVYVVDDRDLDSMLGALRGDLKRLQLLISIHWKMKTYPRVTNIRAGHSEQRPQIIALNDSHVSGGGGGDGYVDAEPTMDTKSNRSNKHENAALDGEVWSMQGRYRNASISSTTYSKQATRNLIRIQDMTDQSRRYIKQNDPECRAMGIYNAASSHRRGTTEMSVLSYSTMNDDDAKLVDREYDGVGSAAAAAPMSLWGSFAALVGSPLERDRAVSWNMGPANADADADDGDEKYDDDGAADGNDDGDGDGTRTEDKKEQEEEEQKEDINKWSRYIDNVKQLISWHSEQPADDIHAQWLLGLENMNMLLDTREKLKAQNAAVSRHDQSGSMNAMNKLISLTSPPSEVLAGIEEESGVISDDDSAVD